ncbi:GDSL-type esterase/lipase family protein [Aliifodinibius salicampi]|uniref:GDSL-type esterase/lipase family protein n=1 Tax=Fodinibius salicampi TaxID=1920655 RepID=A0ABT3PTT6_9BACT|nr:GDSL-type esterase/lipase family protein [Fodinibius salicampi]MCW9711275.1 GDSL-type esterase/lipase family protein [Fodinibius salicampi]
MSEYRATEDEKEVLEKYLLQFLNLEKRYPLLPGIKNEEAIAGLMGIEHDELRKLRDRFAANAKEAAIELLEDGEVAEWIEKLPFEKGDTIVALGDSITDDLQGWFNVFQHVLEIGLDTPDLTFVNSGVSYDTSTDALKRLNRDVLDHDPDWVIVALGTFDAQRLHVAPDRPLVSLADYWENMNTIESTVAEVTDNPLIWMTPPPVISEMLEDIRLFNFNIYEEDLNGYREILTGKKGYIVDPLGERMHDEDDESEDDNLPSAWNYLSDGLHPSLSGHVNTVKELIRFLALAKDPEEGSSFETPDDYEPEMD